MPAMLAATPEGVEQADGDRHVRPAHADGNSQPNNCPKGKQKAQGEVADRLTMGGGTISTTSTRAARP